MVRGKQARKRVQQRLQEVFDRGIAGIDQEVAQLEVITPQPPHSCSVCLPTNRNS